MQDGIERALFDLKEDLEAFRKSTVDRLNFLEDMLPQEYQARIRAFRREQEIEDFRHGRK